MKQKDIEALLREEFDHAHSKLTKIGKHDQVAHLLLYENQYDDKDTIITFIAKALKGIK